MKILSIIEGLVFLAVWGWILILFIREKNVPFMVMQVAILILLGTALIFASSSSLIFYILVFGLFEEIKMLACIERTKKKLEAKVNDGS